MTLGQEVIRYSPRDANPMITGKLIECYREVFADRPWNEWMKCSKCQKFWGIKDTPELVQMGFRHCGKPMVDFWPRDKVLHDVINEVTENSSCWIAVNPFRVIGFCWGYPIKLGDLEEKLEIPFAAELGCSLEEIVAYQDDIGVITNHQGEGIGKQMFANRLRDFKNQGLKLTIARTREAPETSKSFTWFKKLGYRTLAAYPNNDGRVIMGRETHGLSISLS